MKKDSESLEQARFFAWVKKNRSVCPELCCVFAIPNGGYRTGPAAARMKMEGVEPGVPDIFCAVSRTPYHGLFIEMKRNSKSASTSEAQDRMISRLLDGGYAVRVCHGMQEAVGCLVEYLDASGGE